MLPFCYYVFDCFLFQLNLFCVFLVGYDSMTGNLSPESSSSGSDSDSSAMEMSAAHSTWLSPSVDIETLLGDLQDAVKATADHSSLPHSTQLQSSSSEDTVLLGSVSSNRSTAKVPAREMHAAAPPEKRRKLAQNHSDRISGPTAFLGSAVVGLTLPLLCSVSFFCFLFQFSVTCSAISRNCG